MPPKLREIFFAVKDEEQWKDLTGPENKKVTVIDLYYPWFGRCEVFDEALRALHMGLEDPEKKLQYFHVDLAKVPLPKEIVGKQTAKPRFQIYLVSSSDVD